MLESTLAESELMAFICVLSWVMSLLMDWSEVALLREEDEDELVLVAFIFMPFISLMEDGAVLCAAHIHHIPPTTMTAMTIHKIIFPVLDIV
jgi:hypothetical protein